MNPTVDVDEATLFYAEDDPILARETLSRLQKLGFPRVLHAKDLCEAEELTHTSIPDIALLDVHLGMATTIDLAIWLAESGTHIVFTSSYSREELGDRLGDFAFLPKPFTETELSNALKDAAEDRLGRLAAE